MRVSPAIGRSGGAHTYADWVIRAAEIALTVTAWSAGEPGAGTLRSTCAAATGIMTGSSWGRDLGVGSTNARIIQHCFPTLALFTENVASGRVVVRTQQSFGAAADVTGLNRNSYSSASATGVSRRRVRRFIYWDATLGMVMECDPYLATAPIPYDWTT